MFHQGHPEFETFAMNQVVADEFKKAGMKIMAFSLDACAKKPTNNGNLIYLMHLGILLQKKISKLSKNILDFILTFTRHIYQLKHTHFKNCIYLLISFFPELKE